MAGSVSHSNPRIRELLVNCMAEAEAHEESINRLENGHFTFSGHYQQNRLAAADSGIHRKRQLTTSKK